jgi:hypothetical protein
MSGVGVVIWHLAFGICWRTTYHPQDTMAIPMHSAPHPRPFSPEYRGEGSKNLLVIVSRSVGTASQEPRTKNNFLHWQAWLDSDKVLKS